MGLIPLPRELVELANALARGASPEAPRARVEAWLEEQRRALEAQGDHFLSSQDEVRYHNLLHLLEEFAAALAAPEEEALLEAAYRLVPELEAFTAERTRVHFVEIPALDFLLVAGVARLQGRGEREAVARRLPGAREAVERLREGTREEALPSEVRQALEQGFELASRGFRRVEEWLAAETEDALRDGISALRAGGELLSHLVGWHRPPESPLPVGGPELAALRRDPGLAEGFRRAVLPELRAFWEENRARALVSPGELEARVNEVDEALAELEWAVEGAGDLTAAADRLEAAFAGLDAAAMDLGAARGTPLERPVEVVAGAWQGVVPDRVLQQEVGEAPAVQAYLASGQRLHLLEALEALLEEARRARQEPGSIETIA